MGSQLTKNFDVEKDPQTVGGINGIWKVYSACYKDRAKTPVSIFMFDKNQFSRSAKDKQEIVDQLKLEASTLTRLRHPQILRILEPIMEDSYTLAFVTERVEHNLQDLLEKRAVQENVCWLDIKLGIQDLIQALKFLNQDASMVHFNVSPSSIYILPDGKWRLSGLGFSSQIQGVDANLMLHGDFIQYAQAQKQQQLTIQVPLPDYTAPEVVKRVKGSLDSDVFSLGCTIYSVSSGLQGGYQLLIKIGQLSQQQHEIACRNAAQSDFSSLDPELGNLIVSMCDYDGQNRYKYAQLLQNQYFKDPYMRSILYLENLLEKQEGQRQQFLKGLGKILNQFDRLIISRRILPCLISYMSNESLSQHILPNLISALKFSQIDQPQFSAKIWPSVQKIALAREIQAQSMFSIMNDIDLFLSYCTHDQFRQTLVPLIFKGIDCGVPQIQEIIMKNLPKVINDISDVSYINSQILPKFMQGLQQSKSISVKEAGLSSFIQVASQFDRTTILENILPVLNVIRKQDLTSNMTIYLLKIYEVLGKTLGFKLMAIHIIPSLMQILMEGTLTKKQYDEYCTELNTLINWIMTKRGNEIHLSDEIDDYGAVNSEKVEDNREEDIFKELIKEEEVKLDDTKRDNKEPQQVLVPALQQPVQASQRATTPLAQTVYETMPQQTVQASEQTPPPPQTIAQSVQEIVQDSPPKRGMIIKRQSQELQKPRQVVKKAAVRPQKKVTYNSNDFFSEFLDK